MKWKWKWKWKIQYYYFVTNEWSWIPRGKVFVSFSCIVPPLSTYDREFMMRMRCQTTLPLLLLFLFIFTITSSLGVCLFILVLHSE
jgi:hypothetical protein